MWAMVQSSITPFFRGKLFADPAMVVRQLAIGIAVPAAALAGLAALGAPLWLAALAAGLIGGALQPYLFKDLRYR